MQPAQDGRPAVLCCAACSVAGTLTDQMQACMHGHADRFCRLLPITAVSSTLHLATRRYRIRTGNIPLNGNSFRNKQARELLLSISATDVALTASCSETASTAVWLYCCNLSDIQRGVHCSELINVTCSLLLSDIVRPRQTYIRGK